MFNAVGTQPLYLNRTQDAHGACASGRGSCLLSNHSPFPGSHVEALGLVLDMSLK